MKPYVKYSPKVEESFDSYVPEIGSSLAQIYAPDEESFFATGDDQDTLTSSIGSVLFHAKQLLRTLRPIPNTLLYFNQLDESYTTGQDYIVVSTHVFNTAYRGWVNMEFGFDVILGLTAHEMSHILYTDFKVYRKFLDDKIQAVEALKKAKDDSHQLEYWKAKLAKTIHNVVEDERIEFHLTSEFEHTASFIKAVKYHYFKMIKQYHDKLSTANVTLFDKAFSEFLYRVRYPEGIDTDFERAHTDFFQAIDKVLTPYPETYDECVEVIDPLVDLFIQFYEDNEEEIQQQEKEDSQKSLEAALEKIEKGISKLLEQNSEEEQEQEEEPFEVTGVYSDDFSELDDAKVSEKDKRHITAIIREDDVHSLIPKGLLKIHKVTGDINKYLALRKKILPLVPALKKKLDLHSFEKKLIHKSLKSGHLDTGKLSEGYQGVQTIYERRAVVRTSRVCVAVLMDLSGSMMYSKIAQTQLTAILLAEAFKNNKATDLFIYGHTADLSKIGSTDLYIYKEPGHSKLESLSNVSALSMNRDGDALLQTVSRIRNFTQDPCLLFIISDGQPNAYRYNKKGIVHTEKAALEAERKGFFPVHIAIEDGIPSERMFKNHIKMTDVNQLPNLLGQYVKKLFIKHARKIVVHG